MSLSIVTPPTAEPLTWAQVQKQLRLDGLEDDKDFVMATIVPAVRDRGELATGRAFLSQQWNLVLDMFPRGTFLEIPKPPLISIDAVTYLDTAGVQQTWAASNYVVEAPAGPRCQRGRLSLKFAGVWPITLQQRGAVTVTFTCGYAGGTTDDPGAGMPPLLRAAMLTDAGRLYEYRESIVVDSRAVALEVPYSAQDIYRSFRSHATQRRDAFVDDALGSNRQ